MRKGLIVAVAGCLLTTACSGTTSTKVASLQKKDKYLSCSEVMLEINEAEFYRKTAETNKNPGIGSLIMPLSYVSTYVDATDAAKAADSRVDYLNRIYEINKCDDKVASIERQQVMQQAHAAPVSYAGAGEAQPYHVAQQQMYYQQAPMQQQQMQPYGYGWY